MTNYFESPFKGIRLDEQVTHNNIVVGRYSYYSGYYHGHSFDDCARFLLPDAGADKLIVGSFCSIGSGANRRGIACTPQGATVNSRPGTCRVSTSVPAQGMCTRW